MKENIIVADCKNTEINDLKNGLEESMEQSFQIKNKISNGKRSKINNIKRYIIYFTYPFKIFLKRNKYNYIIGWQQFYALIFAFYCNLFKVKKVNKVVVCNFTYKEKKGFMGKIYYSFMRSIVRSKYIDFIHVLSNNYAKDLSAIFDIDYKKFVVTSFGIDDTYGEWKNSKVSYDNYVLALGRSNRDYDFLVEVWNKIKSNIDLVIISDQYKMDNNNPKIHILNNISGSKQFPYIYNCVAMALVLKDENICSGDTVLLKAMSFEKTVVINEPSVLSEMYIINQKNGICIEKDVNIFAKTMDDLLNNRDKLHLIGKNARIDFLNNYSRKKMGLDLGAGILNASK